MTTPTTPKTVGEMTLAGRPELLRATVAESLAGIVGYPDEKREPGPGAEAEGSKPAQPGAVSRVQIVTDEAASSAKMARKAGPVQSRCHQFLATPVVPGKAGTQRVFAVEDSGFRLSPE